MKKLKTAVLALGFAFLGTNAFGAEIKIDAANSKLEWSGSKIIGGAHYGFLDIQSGKLTVNNKGLITAGTITVDMQSMIVNEAKDKSLAGKDKEEDRGKLIGHLKSDEFFGVKQHPTATLKDLKFTKVTGGTLYQVSGMLEIKGVSAKISFPVKKGANNTLTADLEFDRTKYNVRYGSDKFFDNLGNKVISDTVKLQAKIALPKSAPKLAH